ncbi:MIP/aquaporin family protein [Planctopirus hydrillae]|uniref:Aquaporin n=1 Tax=Planctopirus hydrillae TaxID=1841610 RepID=A0A1C3EHL7_9PLAN|nr:aquaporin [Planctopirus hydrillae]ODA32727.1 aquaporin [Planctopirus hydrillae]
MSTRSYVAEAIGTFTLVFAGAGAIVVNDLSGGVITHPGVALTFGLVVMAMIYALGDVSGAHLNPAVTLGFWLARRLPARQLAPYISSQILGAVIAASLLRILFLDHPTLGATLPVYFWWQALILEIILTAILMFVILCVSTGAREKGVMAGAAIGAVVAFEAMFGGPISGASMNPARSFGPAVISGNLASLWIYILAPCIGSAFAVLSFQQLHKEISIPANSQDELQTNNSTKNRLES